MTYLDETTPEEMKLAKRRALLPFGLTYWWQIAVGILLGCVSPLIYGQLGTATSLAMRLVFPYVLLAGSTQLGLSYNLALLLPVVMVYAQFPIEALVVWYAMRRGTGIIGVGVLIFLIHVGGAAALWLMAYTAQVAQ